MWIIKHNDKEAGHLICGCFGSEMLAERTMVFLQGELGLDVWVEETTAPMPRGQQMTLALPGLAVNEVPDLPYVE